MSGMLKFWECQERQTDTKYHTFSEQQAQAELNNDGYFRNGENVGNVRNIENYRNVKTFQKCQEGHQMLFLFGTITLS